MESAVKKNLADSYIFRIAVRLSGISIGLALLSVHLPDHGITLIGKKNYDSTRFENFQFDL